MTDELEDLGRGFRARTLVTARLATKIGVRAVRRTLLGAGKSAKADDDRAAKRARDLVSELGALKGLVMKLGQVASYMPGAMPPAAQKVLAELQAASTPMAWDKIAAVVRADLGADPAALFEDFSPAPFAAASIGQVHRARFEGRFVAVKVQYPGIEEVMASDLDTVGLIARVSTLGGAIDGKALAAELRARTLEECDYRLEAANQRAFGAMLAGDPDARVPAVIEARSGRRVLTSELVDGRSFADFAENAPAEERDRAGAAIFRVCFDSIFRRCAYNADPHPGNYLFEAEGRVALLDFGCVRRFDPQMIDAWKAVALAVLDGDQATFRRRFPDLGMVADARRFDWDHQWQIMRYLYRPFTERPFLTYSDDYVRQSYGLLLFDNPNARRTACPPAWLYLNRLQWGLNSVLAQLRATGPWPDLWRAAVESRTEPWTG